MDSRVVIELDDIVRILWVSKKEQMKTVITILVMIHFVTSTIGQDNSCTTTNNVTSTVDANMDCSGQWEPDVRVYWDHIEAPPENPCTVSIYNDDSSNSTWVKVDIDAINWSDVQIPASGCKRFITYWAVNTTAYLGFSASSDDTYECDSYFTLNCL